MPGRGRDRPLRPTAQSDRRLSSKLAVLTLVIHDSVNAHQTLTASWNTAGQGKLMRLVMWSARGL